MPAAPADTAPRPIKPPSALLLLMEARAPWELAALGLASPWLRRLPQGDGHPVLVFPGLATNDISTLPLRQVITALGYRAHPWAIGFNRGARAGVLEACADLARRLHADSGQKLSLVGWSLGGVYAREVAKLCGDAVRCVVTLGTPFAGPAKANNAWRLYELLSGQKIDEIELPGASLHVAPAVPTTSIYSRSDGVVAWPCSLNEAAPNTENIEVFASHFGIGVNPLAVLALADRLAQDPTCWKPFDRPAALRWLVKRGPARDA